MILLDVNVLVYAAKREFPHHGTAHTWLSRQLAGHEPVAILHETLAATVRLLTHHRISTAPLNGSQALEFIHAVTDAPAAITPHPSPRRWEHFATLVASYNLRGNDIPDAFLAASAIDLGARLATFDRRFARFRELQTVEPTV